VSGRPIPSGWRVVTVDEIKAQEPSSCVAGPFGSSISSKFFVDEGVPVIRGGNLRADLTQFVPEGFVFVSTEQARKYPAQRVKAGDLIFTCWGTIGQVGRIPRDGPFPEYIISNKQLKLRPNTGLADSLFLYYYFASPEMVAHIRGRAIGSAVPGINLGILKELPVVLPPLRTQRKLVAILSAYDDLIENNNRRIKILEEMAQRIYREWFVELRYPGHEETQLTESRLGPMPSAWCVTQLSNLVDCIRDTADAGSLTTHQQPYVPIDCITRRSLCLREWRSGSEAKSSLVRFQPRDVLFGAMRPYFHKVALAPFAGTTRTTCLVLRPIEPAKAAFAILTLFESGTIEYATSHSSGSTIPYARWKGVFSDMPVKLPPEDLTLAFGAIVEPMLSWIASAGIRINKLRAARDLLLPRLISGEIDVEALDIVTKDLVA
jgi:type I restriction enzyme S subunit